MGNVKMLPEYIIPGTKFMVCVYMYMLKNYNVSIREGFCQGNSSHQSKNPKLTEDSISRNLCRQLQTRSTHLKSLVSIHSLPKVLGDKVTDAIGGRQNPSSVEQYTEYVF